MLLIDHSQVAPKVTDAPAVVTALYAGDSFEVLLLNLFVTPRFQKLINNSTSSQVVSHLERVALLMIATTLCISTHSNNCVPIFQVSSTAIAPPPDSLCLIPPMSTEY